MRGRFLRSLEETCQVRRLKALPEENELPYDVITESQQIIILPASYDRHAAELSEIVELDNRYDGNLRPPNSEIQIADQIVRESGQILTVQKSTTIRDVQRIEMEDRDKVIA